MSKIIGIIVDGDGDFASLRKRFGNEYKILKTDGPRGDTTVAHEIASRSRKQIGISRAFKCTRVIVLLDFEHRKGNYNIFIKLINDEYSSLVLGIPVNVAVANRMIENWYLDDIEHLSSNKVFLKKKIKQKNYEGTNGKKELKRCFKRGISYSETKHGPQLFEILRFAVARKNSNSFNEFLNIVGIK